MVASTVALDVAAHEIPADVKLNAFVKPAGNRLELPDSRADGRVGGGRVSAARPGLYRMTRVDEALRSAAKLYLTDNITVYENDAPLPTPRVVRDAHFAAVRQIIRVIRQCACACAAGRDSPMVST